MTKRPKALVIGLDGATFDLIDPLMAQGKLPTIARLVRGGVRGSLRSTIPHHSGPAWASFATGMNPGKHGVYSFFQRDYDSYTYPPVTSHLVRGETLWQLVSRAGGTVGVVNVPGTFPPRPVNGFMISGMLSPSLKQAFWPAELCEQVLQHAPGYSVEAIPLSDRAEYVEQVGRSIEARKQAALYLLEQYPSDLFVVVFTELDRLQHFFWAEMDPDHPSHSPSTSPQFARAIEEGYIALDQAVQELLEVLDDTVSVFVVSDHGFEGVYKIFYVNSWLADHGYLVLKKGTSGGKVERVKGVLQKLRLWRLARRIWRSIPGVKRFRLKNLSYARDVDWDRTKAAFGPNLGININVQGREPRGIVPPGEEYEELCDALRRELESYVDPETGDRIVARVLRREEIYTGDAVGLAPDLRLLMAKSSVYQGQYAYSPKVGASRTLDQPDGVYGNHAEYGILLACGPEIRAGAQIAGAEMVDVAPTILYALGLSIPEEMDGRPLEGMFSHAFQSTREVSRRAAEGKAPVRDETALTASEEQEVLERLRGLGYVD